MTVPVWITGVGAVSPGGCSADETWDAVVNGRPCVDYLKRFPVFGAPTRVAATVPGYEQEAPHDRSLALEYGLAAATEALSQAGLTPDDGTVDLAVVANHGERRMPAPGREEGSVATVEAVARQLGDALRATDSIGLYGACAGGVLAIGTAFKLLQTGMADIAVAGGTDSLVHPVDFYSFCSLYAMTSRDCAPGEASCPFDARRDGFVLAEGAAFVVLEREDHARGRGADLLAVVEGYGCAQNAYHMVASPPDALGPTRAMQSALRDAGLSKDRIAYVNAHGTSTRDNDWCETLAVHKVFGELAASVAMSSSKSELGHTMAAAGAIETVLCVKALQQGVMPPTINLGEPDPRCDLDYVPLTARPGRLDHVMNNSFGFGGHSTSLVLGKAR